jgi:Fic family protein
MSGSCRSATARGERSSLTRTVRAQYQELNLVDRDQAYRELAELVDLGLVMPSKKRGRGATYRVSSSMQNAGRPSPQRVLALRLQTQGSLRNADYREVFGVERHAAKAELRELVRRGVLLRAGERRGTSYSRGPEFDAWLDAAAKRP